MSLRSTSVQPKSGQYVAVWIFNGRTWSATFRYLDGEWQEYDTKRDIWGHPEQVPSRAEYVRYYVAE